MAGTFEVGSILAKFKADPTALTANLKQAGQAIAAFAKRLKDRLKQTKIQFLDAKGIKAKLGVITKQFTAFAKTATKALGKITLKISLKAFKLGLRGATRAAKLAAKTIKKGFAGVNAVFSKLRGAMFSLQGLLATVGAAFTGMSLIRRAEDIDTLSIAFQNLSRSVGATADAFLVDLRAATKGTVSDLDLMRTTNNAVLLGVVKGQKEFAELATIARRLGRAVGRDTVNAINDLAVGIGRQSRLILDNLGLIVKVGDANAAYAAKLGKTVEQLTDAERRTGFFNAAIEAGRKKIAELGPDVDTLSDSWGKFTASLSNVIDVIAKAFVGGGAFSAVGNWLTENEKRIGAFAGFIARTVKNLVGIFAGLYADLFGAGNRKDFIKAAIDFVVDGVEFVLRAATKTLLLGLRILFSKAAAVVFKLVASIFAELGNRVVEQIAILMNKAIAYFKTAITKIRAKIPGVNKLFGLDDPKALDAALKSIEQEAERRAGNIRKNAAKNAKQIAAIIDVTIDEVSEELAGLAEEIASTFDGQSIARQQNRFVGAITSSIDAIKKQWDRLGLELKDPFAGFSTIQTQREIAQLGKVFTKIVKLRAAGIQAAPELITEADVEASGKRLKEFEKYILDINKLFVDLKKAPEEAQAAIANEFRFAIAGLNSTLRDSAEETLNSAQSILKQKSAAEASAHTLQGLRKQLVESMQSISDQAAAGETAEKSLLATADALIEQAEASGQAVGVLKELRQEVAATATAMSAFEEGAGTTAFQVGRQFRVEMLGVVEAMIGQRQATGESTEDLEKLRRAFDHAAGGFESFAGSIDSQSGALEGLKNSLKGSLSAMSNQAAAAGLASDAAVEMRQRLFEAIDAFGAQTVAVVDTEHTINGLRETVSRFLTIFKTTETVLKSTGEETMLTADQLKIFIERMNKAKNDAVLWAGAMNNNQDVLQSFKNAISSAFGDLSKDIGKDALGSIQKQVEASLEGFKDFGDVTTDISKTAADLRLQLQTIVKSILDAQIAVAKSNPKLESLRKKLEDLREEAVKGIDVEAAIKAATAPRFFDSQQLDQILTPFKAALPKLRIDIDTEGLEGAEKDLQVFIGTLRAAILDPKLDAELRARKASFDEVFNAILEKVAPEKRTNLRKFKEEFADMLRQRDAAKEAAEAVKALEQLEYELKKLDAQVEVSEGTLGQLGQQFKNLQIALEKAIEKLPAEKIDEFRKKYAQMAEALARVEIAKVNQRFEDFQDQMALATEATSREAIQIRNLAEALSQFKNDLREAGFSEEKQIKLLEDMRGKTIELQKSIGMSKFVQSIEELKDRTADAKFELEQLGRTELDQRLADIDREMLEMRDSALQATDALLAHAEAAGMDEAQISSLRDRVRELRENFNKQAGALKKQEVNVSQAVSLKESAAELSGTVTDAFSNALMDAFESGESFAKQWANIAAGFFKNSMTKAFDFLQEQLSLAFEKAFGSIGIGAAGGALVSGLLGLAGGIYGALKSNRTSTVDDFEESVNSSEAVRGVVAGPTNVAISAVGDSLKNALRTTEVLLERIAIAVEFGGYGGGGGPGPGGGGLQNNAIMPLSTSTAS